MITLEMLAVQLEEKLNARLEDYGLLGDITPSVNYQFRIILDTADYKDSERNGNTVTMYIHGIMTATSDDVEGVSDNTYNTSLDTSVEFLIPFLFTQGEAQSDKLLSAVRNLLTDTLQSSTGQLVDVDGIIFYQGTAFSLATSGERAERPKVGDSYTLALAVRYFFIANGIGSDDIKLSFGENGTDGIFYPITYSKAEFARTSLQDGNVFPVSAADMQNGETVPSSLSTTTASAFVIKLITPTRDTPFIRAAARYLLENKVKPFWVKIRYPMEYVPSTDPIAPEYCIETTMRMCFSDATLSAELSYNAASTMTLVEAADVDRLLKK